MTLREFLTDFYLAAYEDGENQQPAVFADMAVTEAVDAIKGLN